MTCTHERWEMIAAADGGDPGGCPICMAAEIERLRGELAKFNSPYWLRLEERNQELSGENERLRKAQRPIPFSEHKPEPGQTPMLWDEVARKWIIGAPWVPETMDDDDSYMAIFYPYWLPCPTEPQNA